MHPFPGVGEKSEFHHAHVQRCWIEGVTAWVSAVRKAVRSRVAMRRGSPGGCGARRCPCPWARSSRRPPGGGRRDLRPEGRGPARPRRSVSRVLLRQGRGRGLGGCLDRRRVDGRERDALTAGTKGRLVDLDSVIDEFRERNGEAGGAAAEGTARTCRATGRTRRGSCRAPCTPYRPHTRRCRSQTRSSGNSLRNACSSSDCYCCVQRLMAWISWTVTAWAFPKVPSGRSPPAPPVPVHAISQVMVAWRL